MSARTTSLGTISSTPTTSRAPLRKKIETSSDSQASLMKIAIDKLEAIDSEEDEFTPFGEVVASQLRKMNDFKQKAAMKLINETLFLGSFGILHPAANVRNGPDNVRYPN